MDDLERLAAGVSIPMQPDEDGFTGRECPQAKCEGYFKVQSGTGLKGDDLPCHCPYCGHPAGHEHFWTKEQIEYAQSVAMNAVADALHQTFKGLEFERKPKGLFGIGISMKVQRGQPIPIHNYREKQLETEVVCVHCTLRYSVYGVFAFCPDCGEHNSLQILDKNLDVVAKMLDLASGAERDLAEKIIENALEDCVSAFDGFGRELCRVYAEKARSASKAAKMSFQNLDGARKNLLEVFGIDLSNGTEPEGWRLLTTGFQKRHVVGHRMGIVDEEYVTRTGDADSVVGRRVAIGVDEVKRLAQLVKELARSVSEAFKVAATEPKES